MKELMQQLRESAVKAILECEGAESLEALRVKYLGKKGELTAILRQMGSLSAEERPAMGQLANQLRSDIENAIEQRKNTSRRKCRSPHGPWWLLPQLPLHNLRSYPYSGYSH